MTLRSCFAIIERVMKHRSTTPVSKGLATRSLLVAAAVLMALSAPAMMGGGLVSADQYDDRISVLQQEINEFNARAAELKGQADTLQGELSGLSIQIETAQKQINLSQAKYDKLSDEISETEKQIDVNKTALGQILADMYVDGTISPLEMLASSKNIADYMDQQEYRDSVQDSLKTTINTVQDLKTKLEKQKKEVSKVLAEQKMAKSELDSKQQEMATLLAVTQGEEANYLGLVSDREQKKLAVQQEQQAAIEAAARRGGGTVNVLPGDPNKGGYPWEDGCWVDDYAWSHGGANGMGGDMLGYGCRQCVSYAAWRVGAYTGSFPMYWGNANMWPSSARAAGFATGSTPRANSVGVISAGQFGHVVWVEAVNGDGTVDISQYNYFNAGGPGWGNYSKMRVSASTYDTYIYF